MRLFTIRSGRLAGEHVIYDSVAEFYSEHPADFPLFKWGSLAIQANDWVIADDGYILQCLYRRSFDNKWQLPTHSFRFCIGTFYVYCGRHGNKVKLMYATVTKTQDRGSLGQHQGKDKEFVLYVKSGFTPTEAFYRVFGKYPKPYTLHKIIEKNRGVLMQELTKLAGSLNEKVQAKTGKSIAELFEDKMLEIISTLPKQSIKEAKHTIKWVAEILEDATSKKKGRREIEAPPLMKQEP